MVNWVIIDMNKKLLPLIRIVNCLHIYHHAATNDSAYSYASSSGPISKQHAFRGTHVFGISAKSTPLYSPSSPSQYDRNSNSLALSLGELTYLAM